MKTRLMALAIVLAVPTASVTAQTAANLDTMFGSPMKIYSVAERTWMAPDFSDDGQLCTVRLFPKQIDPGNNYLGDSVQLWEVKNVFDKLAPPATRGKKGNDQGFFVVGRMAFRFFRYDNVSVTFISPDFVRSNATDRQYTPPANSTDEEFPGPHVRSAQIVTIVWTNRKCVQPRAT
jgi:hypothetical protein